MSLLRTGEREVYRAGIEARRAFGGGACTLLVLGTSRGRVLLLHHAAVEAAADMTAEQAAELADCLITAGSVE